MKKIIEKFGVHIIGGVFVLALIVAVVNLRSSAIERWVGDPSQAWFIDEETGEESVRSADEIPPLVGASGLPTVVQVVKFIADNESEPVTGYFVKYSEPVRRRADALPANVDESRRLEVLFPGQFIRSPAAGSQWVPITDAQAATIMSIPEKSPGHPRMQTFPKKLKE